MKAKKEFEVFFDGACPLCVREIRLLRRLDTSCCIEFTDIAEPNFSPDQVGLSLSELMARIHGRESDGSIVEGVEVLRRLYETVGFRRLVAVSRWRGVSGFLDMAYSQFAQNRLRLTGRCIDDACGVSPIAD